ncbi:MAG TPA: hypothetical protein VMM83_04360 [Longimicrobiales bacterium]|nr:hypothetical protein [Longimicrobiales bacterium]
MDNGAAQRDFAQASAIVGGLRAQRRIPRALLVRTRSDQRAPSRHRFDSSQQVETLEHERQPAALSERFGVGDFEMQVRMAGVSRVPDEPEYFTTPHHLSGLYAKAARL